MLILVAVLSGGYLLAGAFRKSGAGIGPALAVQWINHEKAVVVDTRPPEKFEAGHVVNARNLPLEKLNEDGVSGLPGNKTLPVILVCDTGYSAQKAVPVFKKAGYENVHVLAGGLNAWIKAELPLEVGPASKGKGK